MKRRVSFTVAPILRMLKSRCGPSQRPSATVTIGLTFLVTFASFGATAHAVPFCDTVAKDLHFKRGHMNYLPAYGRVMDTFRRRGLPPWPVMDRLLWRHPKRISALVYTLDHASHVAALRDRFLRNTSLMGPGIPLPHHWNYGPGNAAMDIAGYLALRSGEFYASGDKLRGTNYALASVLLSAQSAPVTGRFLDLFLSVRLLPDLHVRAKVMKLPPYRGVPKKLAANYSYSFRSLYSYFDTPAKRATFIALYKKAKAQYRRVAQFYTPLEKVSHAAGKDRGKLTALQKKQINTDINKGFAACVDIHNIFYLLSNAGYLQQRAAHHQKQWIARAIRGALARGLAKLLQENRFSHRDKVLIRAWLFDLASEP